MSSIKELAESWDRLSLEELQAIHHIAVHPDLAKVSVPMAQFLGECLNAEADYREHFRTKPSQVPDWDRWSHGEVAEAHSACILIERASYGGTERLTEWARLLLAAVALEMAARLSAIQIWEDSHEVG